MKVEGEENQAHSGELQRHVSADNLSVHDSIDGGHAFQYEPLRAVRHDKLNMLSQSMVQIEHVGPGYLAQSERAGGTRTELPKSIAKAIPAAFQLLEEPVSDEFVHDAMCRRRGVTRSARHF